jgi:hypothetical protein
VLFSPLVPVDDYPSFISFSKTLLANVITHALQRFSRRESAAVSEAFDVNNRLIAEQRKILLLGNRALGYDDEHALIPPSA